MFPQSFSARVSQRMMIWGAAIGFLLCLYGAAESIQAWQADTIAGARQHSTEALVRLGVDVAPGVGAQQSDSAKKLATEVDEIKALDARATAQRTSHSRNKLLLLALILFVMAEIVVIEYRLLIKPIMRMVKVLQTGVQEVGKLGLYTRRYDEIGAFAQALTSHFKLVAQQQEMARTEQSKLSERLQDQDQFRRESLSFQARIADIVHRLEDHAGRMSTASSNLAKVSSSADQGATASADATLRVSGHVNMVAGSIQDIAGTLTEAADGAEKTSAVAASARSAVETAKNEAKALTEAARTIEQVIALIEDVAGQTNLLALNATIEAARAGEMGRGFGVVAQEVKQLATRTARATEEVRGGLQGITAASQRIAERVAKLAHSIDEVAVVAAGIAQSLREQGANSQSITSTTAQTAEDIRDVAANVKDVASMIGEAKQAAELVTKVSTDLGQQAADLRGAVERFIETTERIAA